MPAASRGTSRTASRPTRRWRSSRPWWSRPTTPSSARRGRASSRAGTRPRRVCTDMLLKTSSASRSACSLPRTRTTSSPGSWSACGAGSASSSRTRPACKQAEQQLLHEALHDALTDLPNRAYFVERVSQALARLRRDRDYRFAVLFVDLDDFKGVNDRLGHAAGDHLLTEIAARLRTCVRPADVVARLGGDEFTLLLEEITGLPDGERAARRIQDALAVPVSLAGQDIVANASIGVVLSGSQYAQPQDLLHDADLAMYHAKQQGRARFQVFEIAMRDSAQARLGMEADLRNALERNELRLVFQPIVRLETGSVHGFEALLRWHRPEQGVVLPAEFVPLAEQTG